MKFAIIAIDPRSLVILGVFTRPANPRGAGTNVLSHIRRKAKQRKMDDIFEYTVCPNPLHTFTTQYSI